ncbi:MAG TPA: hypothetical protein ENJ16_01715, partial [Planctomycetaceae bacterium]|nr:hypothetical protein [Planctomycetaceae bacterium]
VIEFADGRLPIADGLTDVVVWQGDKWNEQLRSELFRVAHPGATVSVVDRTWTVPRPPGSDDWSHPYHGPDNNPLSQDAHSKGPYLTQFLTEPWYVPMPEVTVASGGRLFKAFGHIALKKREWPWLNKLVAINGFNGLLLWSRDLMPGFNIHRNTLIATPETVYLGDNEACWVLDAATGKVKERLRIPPSVDPDGSWKWMALQGEVLYAVVGEREALDDVIRGDRRMPGWPWTGLGNAYAGKNRWGIGRTVVAYSLTSSPPDILWTYRSRDEIDTRGVCMAGGKLFLYSPHRSLVCLDVSNGRPLWRTTSPRVLDAIGEDDPAQVPSKGFSTSAYVKANDQGVFFAGPQRKKLVAVSARDGKLLWTYPHGNFQLILRDDGLYAMGRTETSKVFDYQTGKILADLQCYRGNCTRATATPHAVFTRGYRHTGTMMLDLSDRRPVRIPLMRPACQDGVVIADGRLYWGPWMCDCNHSLVGLICLAPDREDSNKSTESRHRQARAFEPGAPADRRDWPHYRGDVERRSQVPVDIPAEPAVRWKYASRSGTEPTAPIAVGDRVYWGARDGIVRAVDRTTGRVVWRFFTEGPILFPPEYEKGHVYVGSGDGRVTCLRATDGGVVWSYRVAPRDRRIFVHGMLMSNWPVGSGVLVHNGTVFAAAGLASYDGTYVVALEAATGRPRWENSTSGHLAGRDEVTGVSVQGHLLLYEDRLYLAGGNVVSPAVYDVKNGQCQNRLTNAWTDTVPAGRNPLSYPNPRRPYLHAPRGRELFIVDGRVRVFDQLLYTPPTYMRSRYHGGHFLQAGQPPEEVRATTGKVIRLARPTRSGKRGAAWEYRGMEDPVALAVTRNAVLVAGQRANSKEPSASAPAYALDSLDLATGRLLWSHPLPARPVSWGIAITRASDIVVALTSGTVVCLRGPGT